MDGMQTFGLVVLGLLALVGVVEVCRDVFSRLFRGRLGRW